MKGSTIELPILPYVKKFILSELGEEPIICYQNNMAGRQLLNLLVKKSTGKYRNPSNTKIALSLSKDILVHRNRLKHFAGSNLLFLDHFKIALRHWVNGAHPFCGSRREAIEIFLHTYGISPDELNIETCERFFHDRQKAKASFKKIPKDHSLINLLDKIKTQQQVIDQLTETIHIMNYR